MHKIKTAKNRLIALLLSAVLVLAAMPISGVLAAAADTKTAGASGEVWDGTAATAFAGGDGSAENPYQIATAGQLKLFADTVNGGSLDICGVLTADIVLNEGDLTNYDGASANDWEPWTPIGDQGSSVSKRFNGTFDGQGHIVSGLYFNNTAKDYVGLFGFTLKNAVIKNVGVINNYINGGYYVGGVCSFNNDGGTIENCYNTGTVSGTNHVSGVCGYNNGIVENCFNTGKINGSENVGGVCGSNTKTVENCYNTGTISGGNNIGGVCGLNINILENCYNTGMVSATYYVGGVCGSNNGGTITSCYSTGVITGEEIIGGVCGDNIGTVTNCYYLSGTAAGGLGAVGTGEDVAGSASALEADKMTGTTALDNMTGFSADDWFTTADNDGIKTYPQLKVFENNPNAPLPDNAVHISTATELKAFAERVNAGETTLNGVLEKDIVLNEGDLTNYDGASANDWEPWTPIGYKASQTFSFKGTFDGQNHTVSGLYFDNTSTNYVGLFGITVSTAVIKNVGVVNSYINGGNYVGSVCGFNNNGTIENCYNIGTVSGTSSVGGVCGSNSSGSVTNCFNTGKISCNSFAGGVCGGNSGGTISNCYNTGTLSGSYGAGGVCGINGSGAVTNCFNTGSVNTDAGEAVGGVCGSNNDTIENCYNTGAVNGKYLTGGVCGDNSGTVTNCYYLSGTAAGGLGLNSGSEDVAGSASALGAGQMTGTTALDNMTGFSADDWFVPADNYAIKYFPQLKVFENNPNAPLPDNAVHISTAAELKAFAERVNAGETTLNAVLTADIVLNEGDLSGYNGTDANTWEPWTPIGGAGNGYKGTFDGQGHTVSGLYFNNSVQDYAGLFGFADTGAAIVNVGVINSYIYGQGSVGGVCGVGAGTIKNCYNSGTISVAKDVAGGVCGENRGTITNCYNTGSITGGTNAGGVCGTNHGSITNCNNTGTITGTYSYSGGIGGVCGNNNSTGTVTGCYNTGSVNSDSYAGGVCGWNENSVINCYNTGTVSCIYDFAGGVCANNTGNIENCYNTGAVSGEIYIGGVCSAKSDSISVTNCYYLTGTANGAIGNVVDATGTDVAGSAEPLSFGQMTGSSALTNMKLDESIWNTKMNTAVSADGETETLITVSGYFPQLKVFGNTNISVTSTFSKMKTETVGETEYYLIYTASHLKTFANIINGTLTEDEKSVGYTATPYANAKLMTNIVLNPGTFDTDGNYTAVNSETPEQWTPIGSREYYKGSFDGQNHTISGLYFNNVEQDNVGLFGRNDTGSSISNIGVINSYIKGNINVGGVIGYNCSAIINNCYNTGTVNGSGFVGGVCGVNESGTIRICYNTGKVSASGDIVGGVCGDNFNIIINCYNTGTVIGLGAVGGVCGCLDAGEITNCFNIGTVNGSSDTGGVVGYSDNATITNSYYLDTSCTPNIFGTSKNEDEFKSGEVAYLLNSSVTDSTNIWFQTVETDKAPSFDSSRGQVYYSKVYGYTNGFMPSYFVTIPEKVSLGNTEQITLSDVDIGDGKQVTVELMTTELSLVNENKTKINYTITDDDDKPVSGTVLTAANKAEAVKALHFNAPAGYIYAGDYKGTLTFYVAVKEGN